MDFIKGKYTVKKHDLNNINKEKCVLVRTLSYVTEIHLQVA